MQHQQQSIEDLTDANRCIRDLVALSAAPALWVGRDSLQLATGLADVLYGILRPMLVYVGINDGANAVKEVVRDAHGCRRYADAREISRLFAPWFKISEIGESRVILNPIGPGMVRAIALPIGLHGVFGHLAVVSQLVHFPNKIDRLLLGVAASQAATAVQSQRAVLAASASKVQMQRLKDAVEKLLARDPSDPETLRARLHDLLNESGISEDEATPAT